MTQIKAIAVAEHSNDICGTCCRRADAPYRLYDSQGKITQGCVANFHTGHLVAISQSNHWHTRPEAKRIRAATAKFYK